ACEHGIARAVVDAQFAVAVARARYDLSAAVSGEIQRCYADPTGERRGRSKEACQHGHVGPVEGADVWSASGAGACNNVGPAIPVQAAATAVHPAAEARSVGIKAAEKISGGAVKYFDMRSAAGTGSRNNVGPSVPVHIACPHADSAPKRWRIGKE